MKTTDTSYTLLDTPLGSLLAAWNDRGVVAIRFGPKPDAAARRDAWRLETRARNSLTDQLIAYFAGELRSFDLDVVQPGTAFQHDVWGAVAAIPYGETRAYADVAAAIGRPAAVRAVGAANGRNDVPIVVPCHRVIGKGGELRGYGGGVDVKERLLRFEHEGVWAPADLFDAAPSPRR